MQRALAALLFVMACGSSGEPVPTPDAAPSGWQPLITKAWQLDPASEDTSDLQLITIDSEIFGG